MANNRYAGYTPDPSKEKSMEGVTNIENRLNKFNPYEFRKGMDYELTSVGCHRLAESTTEQREVATEKVLKNLAEHSGYYSGLIQFEGGMNHGSKIVETNFKKWLENYMPGDVGTGMVEVDQEIKTDKMTELKEAIKREIKNILEVKGKDAEKVNKADAKADKDTDDTYQKKFDKGTAKDISSQIKRKEDDKVKINKNKAEAFATWKAQTAAADGNTKKKEAAKSRYSKIGYKAQDDIKQIDKDLKDLEDQLLGVKQESKMSRREIAKSMMEKDVHMEILNIIKEHGVNLREGAEGIRLHYEIAKTAYMEGLTAGLKN